MVSVIVPIFNSEQYLHICLESIQKQTFEEIEVLMVNNGSQDRSAEICFEFAKDKRFIYCESPHGIVTACKTGILRASGDLITFVDSDDYIDPTMIERMYYMQITHDCDIVVAGYAKTKDGKVLVQKNYNQEVLVGESLSSAKKNYFCFDETGHRQFYSSKWSKLFKRDILIKNLIYYDESIIEDEDMCLVYPAVLSASKIGLLDGVLYYYVQRKDSVSHTFYKECIKNQLSVTNNLLSALRDYTAFANEDASNIIYNRMLCLIQKARFYKRNKAIVFLNNLYKIEMFRCLDLNICNTTFVHKAKLAKSFLNMDFKNCLSLISKCLIL